MSKYTDTIDFLEKEIPKLEREALWMIEHGHFGHARTIGHALANARENLESLRDLGPVIRDIQDSPLDLMEL